MGCPICKDLERAYEVLLSEYNQARSSACFQVSRRLAAKKNVEMERARYELEEHRSRCAAAAGIPPHSPEKVSSKSLGRVAA